MFFHLSMSYGWSFEYIKKNVTLAEIYLHYYYQRKNPPLFQLFASYSGFYEKLKEQESAATKEEVKSQIANGGFRNRNAALINDLISNNNNNNKKAE